MANTAESDRAHLAEAERAHLRALRRMTPAQKYAQLMMLRKTAWDLKVAALREKHPELDEATIQSKVAQIFIHATT